MIVEKDSTGEKAHVHIFLEKKIKRYIQLINNNNNDTVTHWSGETTSKKDAGGPLDEPFITIRSQVREASHDMPVTFNIISFFFETWYNFRPFFV